MIRYYDSVKQAFEDSETAADNELFEMFQRFAARLLLGEKSEQINARLDKLIADYEPTGRLNIDLTEMTYLAALKELSGESGIEAARKGLSFLQSQNEIDEEQYQIVESALALAFLNEDSKLVNHFFEAGLKLSQNNKTLTFELLFLTLFGFADEEILERLANIVARVIAVSIWLPPFYSAASHVCVLARITKLAGGDLRGLLKNGLKRLDKEVFESGESPRLEFSEPNYRLSSVDKKGAVLTAHQKVAGAGTLNAGVYALKEFTSHLPQTIQTAADQAKIREIKKKQSRSVLLKNALEKKNGEFRAVLDLAKDVELKPLDKKLLQKRFNLGWKIAKNHIDKLSCGHKLEINVPKSSE